jgi:electron transport complex protein RnfB
VNVEFIILAATEGVPIGWAILVLAGLGAIFGVALYVGSRVFAVEVDPRVDQILEALPGANCGACGLGGCRAYAEAVVLKGLATGLCAPGGPEACAEISKIMGVAAESAEPTVAVVHCQGNSERSRMRGAYAGLLDCRAALVPGAGGGATSCAYGCLGYGTCVAACPFDAIVTGPDGLPQVVERLCTGCGNCIEACPRGIIRLHSRKTHVFVLCASHEKAKVVRAACDVGCIGCKRCEKECQKFEAIELVDNLAVVDDAKCKNCAKCVAVCPRGTIWNLRKARKAIEKKDSEKRDKEGKGKAVPAACPSS